MIFNNRRYRCFFVFLAFLPLISCGGKEKVVLTINDVKLTAEVVRTPESRNKGLMYRKSMGEYEGMLFVFENDQKMSFWMKNTSIPLSIAFIARDGEIREIYDMQPFSEASVKSKHSVLLALEVNQGFFNRHDIAEGDRIVWPEDFILR